MITIGVAAFTITQAGAASARFVPVTPCRVADTRNAAGPFGGPAVAANNSRTFAGPVNGMFNFNNGGSVKAVILDPTKGTVASGGNTGGTGGGTTTPVTGAVANPKNATVTQVQFQLDGTGSTSADGKALTYAWTLTPGSPVAAINGANTATPTVQFGSGLNTYSFLLTITDSTGKTATDTATISYVGR
jgi:hypothetical protein